MGKVSENRLTRLGVYVYASVMHRFQIFLALEQLKRLRELATSTGLSVAEHIRRAIDAYLGKI